MCCFEDINDGAATYGAPLLIGGEKSISECLLATALRDGTGDALSCILDVVWIKVVSVGLLRCNERRIRYGTPQDEIGRPTTTVADVVEGADVAETRARKVVFSLAKKDQDFQSAAAMVNDRAICSAAGLALPIEKVTSKRS
jgi:hypothetical protein